MVRDLELMKDIRPLLEGKVVIWGYGWYGRKIYRELNQMKKERKEDDIIFCDGSEQKQKEARGTVKVIAPEQLKNHLSEDISIIISPDSTKLRDEIIQKIDSLGYGHIPVFSKFGYESSLYLNREDKRLNADFRERCRVRYSLEVQEIRSRRKSKLLNSYQDMILHASVPGCIILHEPEKVGSTTIEATFAKYGLPEVNAHILNDKSPLKDWEELTIFITELRDEVLSQNRKIISVVREPIARYISWFWQRLRTFDFKIPQLSGDLVADFETFLRNEASKWRNRHILSDGFEWFNYEMRPVFGIDVYKQPFDPSLGYTRIERKGEGGGAIVIA